MNYAQLMIFGALAILSAVALWTAWSHGRRHPERRCPNLLEIAIGFVTDFFDALGIGSFPTSTSIFRLRRLVPEELIPGTLNIGHAPAAVAEAVIFVSAVLVDPVLLGTMTALAAIGAWLGAGLVLCIPRRGLQWVLGIGTLIGGLLFIAANLHVMPLGGEAYALHGLRFAVAATSGLILGMLMAAGVGLFGPCMIVLALLGLHPLAAFPIMMAAGSVQQLVSGIRYLRSDRYAFGPAVGLALGGGIGAVVAALIVKSLPVIALRWLVAIVALYVAQDFLRNAVRQPTAN